MISFVFLFYINYYWICGSYLTDFIMILLFDNIDTQTWYTEKEKLLSYQLMPVDFKSKPHWIASLISVTTLHYLVQV